ncbi:hypothetical protein ACP4OV_019413 [Aristida adscensionis]
MKAAVWSIVATIILGIVVLVINKWWDPIAEYLGYPFNVRRRVKALEDVVHKLCWIQADLHRLDPQPSSETGKGWVQSVQDLRIKAEKIKIGLDGCGLINYFSRCYFGKQADEELKKATDLETRGNSLLQEARAKPRPVRRLLHQHPRDELRGFESYKKKALEFIELNPNKPPLGIWGMGGVGKTALLKLLRDNYAGSAAFDHVLLVGAGRGCTVAKLQAAIATTMGLPEVQDEIAQEAIICNHLQDKSFLLLVDDLWGFLHLEAVGIPMPLGQVMVSREDDRVRSYKRKVVFTTRSLDVCGGMGCPRSNNMEVKCLSKRDAWNLFTDKVGSEIVNGTHIRPLAEKIVDECNGLPEALCIIGRAMSTKESVKEWISAIDLLETSKIYKMMNNDDDLFARLKLSYDNMPNDRKECFLVCSLWPGDENIPMEKLVEWWIGLGLLDVSKPIDTGYSIIYDLVRQSMLEKGDTNLYSAEKTYVKMHEVIRKMALHIVNGPQDQDRWLPLSFCRSTLSKEKWCIVEKAWISSEDSSSWSKNPTSFSFPQLRMLVSRHPFSFEVMPHFEAITFLDMRGTKIDEFPLDICRLINLQYLNLSATRINGLPLKLQYLSNLKFLCVRDTAALQTIPKGVISQLKKLQGLDLFCSGINFHMVQYLSLLLEDLASVTANLLMLGITVHSRVDITELGKFNHVCTQALCMQHFVDGSHPDSINLQLLSYLDSLRELTIMDSSETLELVAEGNPNCNKYGLLPKLEFFELRNLLKLQNMTWKNAGLSIRVVVIYNCAELKQATWLHHLQSLEELTIAYCAAMEQVIGNVEEANHMAFSNLKKLYLEQLPELSIVSAQAFPFRELSYAFASRCEKLKIAQVEKGSNQHQIMVDCDQDWWASSVQNEGINNPLFVPKFSLSELLKWFEHKHCKLVQLEHDDVLEIWLCWKQRSRWSNFLE